jgi:DNA-binding beta-propeller fold protein YncE
VSTDALSVATALRANFGGIMKQLSGSHRATHAFAWLACATAFSSAAVAAPQLLQTIDLSTWAGTPISVVQPPPPLAQPASGFSLTSIAFDPVLKMIYASDNATTNVYLIDAVTGGVNSVVYTNGLASLNDIGTGQNIQGTGPKVVLANPAAGRWAVTGQGGGGQFSGTTFAEGVNARAMQSGAAWDPGTGNFYGADGIQFVATNNLKFLLATSCAGANNAVAVNPVTSRVYVSCNNSAGTGDIIVFDGVALSNASVKVSTPPVGTGPVGIAQSQPTGLAVNPNTNRVYVAGLTSPTSLDVLDGSSFQLLTSLPVLPDQSARFLVAGFNGLPLPRPVAVNTLTNTIFVVNSVNSTISVIDGATNTLSGTIAAPVPDGAVVSQPYASGTQLSEVKLGNTTLDTSASALTTLGGAIAIAVNETANLLYVANVNGTISVFALDPPTAPPTFSISGVVKDSTGAPLPGITVSGTGFGGASAATTDSTGLFVLTGLAAGSYTIAPATFKGTSFPSQVATVSGANVGKLVFTPAAAPVAGGGGGGGGTGTTQFTVSVGRSNPGTVIASPSGVDRALNCGNACSAKFNAGTAISLVATPPAGKSFVSWGGACAGTAPTCDLTVNANLSVQANFSK